MRIKISLSLFLAIILFFAFHLYSNAPVTRDEVFRPDETQQAQRSVEQFIKNIEADKTSYVARGAHSKGHACVKAYFDINKDIKPEFQHGLFSMPDKSYKAWIRFSNGKAGMKENYDTNKDAHGMAIKLFDLYQHGLKQESENIQTQEFLMHDSPVFFAANIDDYNKFLESEDKILYFVAGLNPFKWQLRELLHALNTLKLPPISPLKTQYFSNTAYKLGPHNIKFSAKSCALPADNSKNETNDPDYLNKILTEELKQSEGCFEFMVQVQDPEKYMPIEDPSIEWRESDSPFLSVAKIRIPKQEFNSTKQKEFCENLSFSPWHSLAAHRPIGELNRIRQKVYKASSEYRHSQNNADVSSHLDW